MLPWFGARSRSYRHHTPLDRRQILPGWSRDRSPPCRGCRRVSRSNCSPPTSAIRARFGSRRTATSSLPNRSRGRIRVLRAADGAAKPSSNDVFASGLDQPFGIAFYPSGSDPQWIYVANTGSVVRYPYRSGDLKARGKAEVIVRDLPHAGGRSVQRGHITRDIVFSRDGRQMFVSVGSASNAGEGMGKRDAAAIARWEAAHGLGSAWGNETDRAAVLVFDPDGRNRRVFASGLRNCVGLAVHPVTGDVWCSTNERDGLGDDLVPDFVTRVRGGAFYGWPWYYLGANEDPRHRGERPDLKDKITVPDVLIQAHSASMGMIIYDGDQ